MAKKKQSLAVLHPDCEAGNHVASNDGGCHRCGALANFDWWAHAYGFESARRADRAELERLDKKRRDKSA